MKLKSLAQIITAATLTGISINAFAWDHSFEIGYGRSNDLNKTRYTNSAIFINGDLYHFYSTHFALWSLNGAISQLHSTAPINKNVTTAAISATLRVYPFQHRYKNPFYFLGSWGPAYLSKRNLGTNTQASNLTFQWNLGLGMEFNEHWDASFRFLHFSNAYLARPDEGFTVTTLLSIGYLF